MPKHRRVLSPRSLAPLAFVLGTGSLVLAAPRVRAAHRLLAAGTGTHRTGMLHGWLIAPATRFAR